MLKEFYLPELIGHIGFSIVKYDEMEIKEFLGVDEACREGRATFAIGRYFENNKVTQKDGIYVDSDETSTLVQ